MPSEAVQLWQQYAQEDQQCLGWQHHGHLADPCQPRTSAGPLGPWRSMPRSLWRFSRSLRSPGRTILLLEVTKSSSRMSTCHKSPCLPRAGAWVTSQSSGPRRSWPQGTQTVTPWTGTFVAFADRMSRKTPAMQQPPWWGWSCRWCCPSSGTSWQRPAGGPGREPRPWWKLAAILVQLTDVI